MSKKPASDERDPHLPDKNQVWEVRGLQEVGAMALVIGVLDSEVHIAPVTLGADFATPEDLVVDGWTIHLSTQGTADIRLLHGRHWGVKESTIEAVRFALSGGAEGSLGKVRLGSSNRISGSRTNLFQVELQRALDALKDPGGLST